MSQNSYDTVPYDSFPFAQSHPSRMGAMAKLFGLDATDIASANVLELGCAFGGNLMPLAARYPQARFTGIDLSLVQIERARRVAAELGLRNIEFRHANIVDVAAENGSYDYIITHGVYSWIPTEAQDALLRLCSTQLSPKGVAYISYNVYPGWKMREVAREMMLFHVGHLPDHKLKLAQARAILQYAGQIHAGSQAAFGKLMNEEATLMMRASDSYLFHEHLEANNRPCYFHEFAAAASRHQLTYLGESSLFDMLPDRWGAELATMARKLSDGNIIACEQYTDLFTNRAFRQTLLIRSERAAQLQRALTPASFKPLHLCAQLKISDAPPASGALATYVDAHGRQITANQGYAKVMLDALAGANPHTLSYSELVTSVQHHAQQTGLTINIEEEIIKELTGLLAQGLITIYGDPMPRPESGAAQISPYALWQLRGGSRVVTNTLHQLVELTPAQTELVLSGRRPDAQQAAELIALGVMV